jgi:hypothetical protein
MKRERKRGRKTRRLLTNGKEVRMSQGPLTGYKNFKLTETHTLCFLRQLVLNLFKTTYAYESSKVFPLKCWLPSDNGRCGPKFFKGSIHIKIVTFYGMYS